MWDISVRKQAINDKLQSSVATNSRCGGILNNHFTENLLENLTVEEFWKSVQIWRNYGHEFGVQFLGPPCKYAF